MGVGRRVATWTTLSVALTVTLVLAGAFAASAAGLDPVGQAGGAVLGGAMAMALVPLGKRWAVAPTLERLGDLTRHVEATETSAGHRLGEIDDTEIAPLAQALNRVLDKVQDERDEALREAELMRDVVMGSPNGLLITDTVGRVRRINPSLRAMIDLRGEPEGRRPIEVVPIAEVQGLVDRILDGQTASEVAVVADQKDLLLRPIPLAGGGAAVLFEDITRFKTAERARSDFVANVSHELRTPITSIMGYAETILAESDRLDADVDLMVRTIHRNANRLRDIFEDLLALARVEARSEALVLQNGPILGVLAEAVAPAADRCAQRGQSFELDCPDDLWARFSPEALTTIVANLATNASKYTPEGGNVRIRAFARAGEVVIEVTDDGVGIARAQLHRVFERFFRVDSGRSREVGGTGLGLAIAKHLSLASRAHLEVESELGKGSTFRLVLPGSRGAA